MTSSYRWQKFWVSDYKFLQKYENNLQYGGSEIIKRKIKNLFCWIKQEKTTLFLREYSTSSIHEKCYSCSHPKLKIKKNKKEEEYLLWRQQVKYIHLQCCLI